MKITKILVLFGFAAALVCGCTSSSDSKQIEKDKFISDLMDKMTLREKLFYAMCISHNRFKFSYGRKPKGDRLASILLPARMAKRFDEMDTSNLFGNQGI